LVQTQTGPTKQQLNGNAIDISLVIATNIARVISLLQRAAPAHMQAHDI
jgi:hypothetical protein